MNCSDSVCIRLMTCKWDTPISKTWCEAMYYPDPEREKLIERPVYVEHIQEKEQERKPYQPVKRRQPEFFGRSYRENRRSNS